MKTIHKVGLGVAVGTLAVGGIAGASLAQADPTAAPTASGSATPQAGERGAKGDRGAKGGVDAAQLATKLGLDTTTVQQAVDTVRQNMRDQQSSTTDRAARQQAFAEALASELGVSTDRVTTALAEIRAEREAERKAALKTKLDQAVTDGTLTQAEADAVMKAAEAGVIGYGR